MVDVSAKEQTSRIAIAEGYLHARSETLRRIEARDLPKGEFIPAVEIAGILGAKKTSELLPLCHPIALDSVKVALEPQPEEGRLRIIATAGAIARTGVEMEALTAVSISLLAAYDLLKPVDRNMTIGGIRLLEKRGGRSGDWKAERA
jgi:cyclic pyranopterin monophosphate synthase